MKTTSKKVVILAGGLGTRIGEETLVRPNPMIEIGGRPVIWHIMKHFSYYGHNDFIILCGHLGYKIKEYFCNYSAHNSHIRVSLRDRSIELLESDIEPWTITLLDTGSETQTGGRLGRAENFLKNETCFFFTYGDGLSDVNLDLLVRQHLKSNCWATVTAVRPPARFGALKLDNEKKVISFREKPVSEAGLINGGFFVLNPKVIDLISGDLEIWEEQPLRRLSEMGELSSFFHDGFWHAMDTPRDKSFLEGLYASGSAPWKIW